MKNSVKMIAAIGMMAAMVAACSKMELDNKSEAGDNTSAYGYIPSKKAEDPNPQTDTLIRTNHYGWEWIELVINYEYKSTNTWKKAGEKDLYGSSMTRPISVVGGAKVEKEVSSEAELDGVKYTESEVVPTTSHWNANDWYGEQCVRTLASKLSNGKYGADFELTYSSSDAHFAKDSLAKDFPDVAWNHSVKDTLVKANVAADNGGYYKTNNYIAIHTLVANVVNDFVKAGKEAQASKKFEVRDTLSLKFFVAPDPEDKFMRRWMVVELSEENQTIKGAFVTREEWSLSGIIEVDRKPFVRTATAQGQNYGYVLASTDGYKTTGTKVEGTGNMTFNASASNGHEGEGFVSAFSLYGDESITYSYKDCTETVTCKLACDGVQQNITAKGLQTINGVYYNVSDYVASIAPVYTATWKNETASIDLYATSTREIRVKVDEVIENIRRVKTVTEKENGNGFDIKVDFYVKSNIYGEYVKTLNDEFVYTYTNRSHEDVIAESAKESETKSNGKVGDLKGTYSNTLTVGNKKSDNVYDWTLNQKESVLSFNGVSEKTVVDLSIAEQGSPLATSAHTTKVVNNVTYDAYAYKNSTRATLTCEGKKVTKDASTAYDVLVKHDDTVETKVENKDYAATAKVNGNVLTFNGVNSWETVDYVNGKEKTGSRKSGSQEEIITATLTVTPTFVVAEKAGLNAAFTWTSFGETGDEPEQTVVEEGKTYKVKVRNFRGYVAGKPAYLRLEKKNQVVEKIDGLTLATTSVDAVKAVDLVASFPVGNNVTLTPKVDVTLSTDDGVATKAMVGEAKTYTIEGNMVGTYTPETTQEYEPEVVNGRPVVHEYDVTDGVRTFKQDYPYTPNKNLAAQSAKDMYGENYSTVYNGTRNVTTSTSTNGYWTVENTKGQVYSTLSNGVSSDDNIADYGFDSKMTFKKGNYSYTFVGTSTFANSTDALKDAGTKTISGITYNVSDYKENFNMVYTIDGTTIDNLSDAVKRQILVEKEAEDIIPGTIKWIAFRAVAAIPDGNGGYKNADGHMQRIKGVAVGTEEGKVCYIPFADAADGNAFLPSATQFANANWCEASYYNESYVAGYDKAKNGVWYPALVDDRTNQIVYFDGGPTIEESTAVRSLTQKSMNTWDWSTQTSVVDGYTISDVKDGVVTITFNGQTRTIK